MSGTHNRSGEELRMRVLVAAEMQRRWPDATIIEELPLRYSERRIDLAAIRAREIIGAEIKSSRDTLSRLEDQLRGFAPICSHIIVAVAPKWWAEPTQEHVPQPKGRLHIRYHPCECEAIIQRVGAPVAVWTVDVETSALVEARPCYRQKTVPWSAQLLSVLRVEELKAIAERRRVAYGKRATHSHLVEALHDLCTGREVIEDVCATFAARYDPFPTGGG